MTGRFADVRAERPRWRFNLAYGVDERLLIGVEYNAAAGEIGPTANYTLMFESAKQPLISLGTSSDRIFSPPHTRAYYATVGKTLPGTPLSPYVTLNWSTWEDRFTFPFGVNYAMHPNWDAMVQHDGRNTHWLLTYKTRVTSLSLLLVKGRHWGVSAGIRF